MWYIWLENWNNWVNVIYIWWIWCAFGVLYFDLLTCCDIHLVENDIQLVVLWYTYSCVVYLYLLGVLLVLCCLAVFDIHCVVLCGRYWYSCGLFCVLALLVFCTPIWLKFGYCFLWFRLVWELVWKGGKWVIIVAFCEIPMMRTLCCFWYTLGCFLRGCCGVWWSGVCVRLIFCWFTCGLECVYFWVD